VNTKPGHAFFTLNALSALISVMSVKRAPLRMAAEQTVSRDNDLWMKNNEVID